MVEVYCDESENESPAIFTLAGWIATPSAWRAVSEAWSEMLQITGPHPVTTFHMSHIAAGTHEFASWQCYESVFFQTLRRPAVQNGIEFVFDRKKGAEHHVLNHFSAAKDAIKNTDGGLLSRCSFEDDEKTIPLQAADFLTYELRRATYQRPKHSHHDLRYSLAVAEY